MRFSTWELVLLRSSAPRSESDTMLNPHLNHQAHPSFQVSQGNRIQRLDQAVPHLFPDAPRTALGFADTGGALLLGDALDGQNRTFEGTDDIPGRRRFGCSCQSVASLDPALADLQAGLTQGDGNLLQVGLGDALSLCNF